MSTRSRIAIENEDGTYTSIYCHFDGKTIINILRKLHSSKEEAEKIISLGDISSLTEKKITTYKERGDKWSQIKPIISGNFERLERLAEREGSEFLNVYQDYRWRQFRI